MPTQSGRSFAAFDIDGTLIRWQLYHAIADALAKQGHVDAKTYQAVRNARMEWKRRSSGSSFKTYEQHLIEFYDQLLENLSVEHFTLAAERVFDEYKDQVYVYTRDLIKQLKNDGYLLFALSGSQLEIVEMVANYYGFDDYVGTTYERSGKFFTGTKIVHLGTKDKILEKLASRHKVGKAGSIGIGDSAGDISMLEYVDTAIAFNPEKALFDHAKQKGWKIVIERKNMVYELSRQGEKYELD